MRRLLAAWREASEGYYGSVTTQQPDLAAILVIYVAVFVYPIETHVPLGSMQQGSLTCKMVSLLLLQRQNPPLLALLLVKWCLHHPKVKYSVRVYIWSDCRSFAASFLRQAVLLFYVCILTTCGLSPWESQAKPYLKQWLDPLWWLCTALCKAGWTQLLSTPNAALVL